jgi:hypothetical protein
MKYGLDIDVDKGSLLHEFAASIQWELAKEHLGV